MKTVLRIFIILLAAVVIGGVTLALVNTNGSAASVSQTRDGFRDRQFSGSSDSAGVQPPSGVNGNFRPDHGGERIGGGAFSWATVMGDFLLVVVVIVLVALFERLLKAVRTPKVARVPVRSSEVERKE